jgi:leucyl-tRNA synthetase
MEYEIVAKTKKEADEILEKKECVKVEDIDDYGDTFRETIKGRHVNDMSGDEPVEWKKIEECLPRDDIDIDTDKRFLNYEDPDWISDDYEWIKNEDGTNITKEEAHG